MELAGSVGRGGEDRPRGALNEGMARLLEEFDKSKKWPADKVEIGRERDI